MAAPKFRNVARQPANRGLQGGRVTRKTQSMETVSNPPPTSEIPWKISGTIAPAKIKLAYKLGVLLNALAMLLLPAIYLAMVGGLGWFIYAQMTTESPPEHHSRSGDDSDAYYFFLLIAGAITLFFMIKPFFGRRPKQAPPLEITRAEQPGIFALIDEICALVRSPRPQHVFVDMQINASASFSRAFGSLFRRDLTLTIGLPLVAGLNVQELGGVLAHEFGHFAQGAGMRLTYVIRSINAWFARIVYQRDTFDDLLREASKRLNIRIGILFYAARLMVWLTRKILWVFMWVGHALSCFMLRQMEFDADYYETAVAGSASFARTANALQLLGAGWRSALNTQQESYTAGRLVEDMPRLVALEAGRLPLEVRDAITQETAESKTGWFDTHPSDADRVRAAEKAGSAGVLGGEGPATTLFADFSAVARHATADYYRCECKIDLAKVQLLPFETVADDVKVREETEKATKELFQGLLTTRTMPILFPAELRQTPSREQLAEEWRAARERQLALHPGAEKVIKELAEADSTTVAMAQAGPLFRADFKLKAGQFGLAKPSVRAVNEAQEEAENKIKQCHEKLATICAATRERFLSALRAYYLDPLPRVLLPEAPAEIEPLVRIISRFDTLTNVVISLRNQVAAFDLLLRNMPKDGSSAFSRTARDMGSSMLRATDRLLEATADLEYTFDHVRGKVLLSAFLVETPSHNDESIAAFLRARALLDRLFGLFDRINGRLAQLALLAEQNFLSGSAEPNSMEPESTLASQC
jgi:Zn-dependent protease with chaperone function